MTTNTYRNPATVQRRLHRIEAGERVKRLLKDPVAADSRVFEYRGDFFKFFLRTQANGHVRETRLCCSDCRQVVNDNNAAIVKHIEIHQLKHDGIGAALPLDYNGGV